jgi:hypothetical protein
MQSFGFSINNDRRRVPVYLKETVTGNIPIFTSLFIPGRHVYSNMLCEKFLLAVLKNPPDMVFCPTAGLSFVFVVADLKVATHITSTSQAGCGLSTKEMLKWTNRKGSVLAFFVKLCGSQAFVRTRTPGSGLKWKAFEA